MSDGKTVFHIEVESKNAGLIWSLLSNNLNLIVNKKQHSIDGKDINIYIRIDEENKS